MSGELWDFGFTAVDEDELSSVQSIKQEAQKASESSEKVQDRLDRLYNAITPLINNLKKFRYKRKV